MFVARRLLLESSCELRLGKKDNRRPRVEDVMATCYEIPQIMLYRVIIQAAEKIWAGGASVFKHKNSQHVTLFVSEYSNPSGVLFLGEKV